MKLISSFVSQRKSRISVEGKISTPRNTQAGVPQGSVLYSNCTIHINNTPQTPGVYLSLFADDTCIYATDNKESFVLRKLQQSLSAIGTWCEH
jgi:hypothetical protein